MNRGDHIKTKFTAQAHEQARQDSKCEQNEMSKILRRCLSHNQVSKKDACLIVSLHTHCRQLSNHHLRPYLNRLHPVSSTRSVTIETETETETETKVSPR